jgi:hypothetical protein
MGIYSNGSIFGIQIYNFKDDVSHVLFEEKYDEIMSYNQMREAYLFYTNLHDKKHISFTPLNIYNGTPAGRLNRDLRATLPINELKGNPPIEGCPILNLHRCKIYTECSSTLSYGMDNFMMWQPLPLDTFLEKFGV